jgi:polyisoprenyl-phosphate glycosyltransferase
MTRDGAAEIPTPQKVPITVLVPVFNDWMAADSLIRELDRVFGQTGLGADVLVVDDGSTEGPPVCFPSSQPKNLQTIRILELKNNVGHQRALCIGLVWIYESKQQGAVLIMDADGEDAPSDIPRLLDNFLRAEQTKVIFAERGRRVEGFAFKLFYQLYRIVHWLLVGFDIRIGNFSLLPARQLDRLVVSSDLWNHYAAAVIKTKLPYATVRLDRAKRLHGKSTMSFTGLAIHGLSAMSVFGDTVGTRLLMLCSGFASLAFTAICVTVAIRLATHLAIPGWATSTAGLLLVLVFQSLTLALVFTFVVLSSRGQSSFIPIRDCPYYIRGLKTAF